MAEIALTREFRPHRRAPYCNQRASCGCVVYGSMMGESMGELCERRLTGPRCDRTEGCIRPLSHHGECETEVRYG